MAKIILCRGIQGSGKTTWAKQWVLEDPEHRVRFNNDDVRNMLGKYWVPNREVLVYAMKKQFIITSMKEGYDIVIDNMNLSPKEVEYYESYIKIHNQVVDNSTESSRELGFNAVERCKYCGKPATHEGLCEKCYNMRNY